MKGKIEIDRPMICELENRMVYRVDGHRYMKVESIEILRNTIHSVNLRTGQLAWFDPRKRVDLLEGFLELD